MCNYTVLAICLRNEKLIDSTLRQLSSVSFDPTMKGFSALESAVKILGYILCEILRDLHKTSLKCLFSNKAYSVIAAFVFRRIQKAKDSNFKPEMPVQKHKYIVCEASTFARRRARGGSVDSISLRKVLGHKILKRRIEKPVRNNINNSCALVKCVYCSNN